MIRLYQTEWCPHSHRVRQRLTELGVPFVAVQVEADREDRDEMRAATGADVIPVLVLDDGHVLDGDADEILAELDRRFDEAPDAVDHKAKGPKLQAAD